MNGALCTQWNRGTREQHDERRSTRRRAGCGHALAEPRQRPRCLSSRCHRRLRLLSVLDRACYEHDVQHYAAAHRPADTSAGGCERRKGTNWRE